MTIMTMWTLFGQQSKAVNHLRVAAAADQKKNAG
jgi:hypothetical protein